MSERHHLINRWFAEHHGIIGADQLHQFGCSAGVISNMVRRGTIVPVARGVYRSATHPAGTVQLMAAACQRHPLGVIAFTTACILWRIRGVLDRAVHLLVPHGTSPELPAVVVHRCRRIDPVDVVVRPDGIRVTSPPRTLFDSGDLLGSVKLGSAIEQVLNDGMCTLGTLVDTHRRLGHPRRPGSRLFGEALRSREPWRAAVQSHLEYLVLDELTRQGLPLPFTQHPIEVAGGRVVRVDFAWPVQRVIVEVDHPAWHADPRRASEDHQRDRLTTACGWQTSRVSAWEVEHRLRTAVEQIGTVISQRHTSR